MSRPGLFPRSSLRSRPTLGPQSASRENGGYPSKSQPSRGPPPCARATPPQHRHSRVPSSAGGSSPRPPSPSSLPGRAQPPDPALAAVLVPVSEPVSSSAGWAEGRMVMEAAARKRQHPGAAGGPGSQPGASFLQARWARDGGGAGGRSQPRADPATRPETGSAAGRPFCGAGQGGAEPGVGGGCTATAPSPPDPRDPPPRLGGLTPRWLE